MICFDESKSIIRLDTPHTSYVMGVFEGRLVHYYYGKRISGDVSYLLCESRFPWMKNVKGEAVNLNDTLPFEYPTSGVGDYREPCLSVRAEDGTGVCDLRYVSHEIKEGKTDPEGLPATHGTVDAPAHTLTVTLRDEVLSLDVILSYTVFEDSDALVRSVSFINHGEKALYLERALSTCLELPEASAVTGSGAVGLETLSLVGGWSKERHMVRTEITQGIRVTGSKRGKSSHQMHPFAAVIGADTTWSHGEVYAMNLIYSSDHYEAVECTEDGRHRIVMGIHPEGFVRKLSSGETFYTPEALTVYSDEGLNGMSHVFHDLYRDHILPEKWAGAVRPVLINNWEATYFDYDDEKILEIAKKAKSVGIEMMVIDDGWFGHRNSDDSSLGDWYVNEDKLDLKKLSDEIHALGMKVGLWFEPEMISTDSELYKEHPDWALNVPERIPSQSRNQLVLDMSRDDVRDYIYEKISDIIMENDIDYVKWDMNRPLSDIGSSALPADRQAEVKHRVMLGVYDLQRRLTKACPHLLLENCSAGGARFDGGMLCFSPQIWCSDDMDPRERMITHAGTALIYPLSTISAHVPTSPDHAVDRETSFDTRAAVAMQGAFGYELDITKLSEEELEKIPEQILFYRLNVELIQSGDYYRLATCEETENKYDSYMIVSKDKKEALLFFCQVIGEANARPHVIRLQGLDLQKEYRIEIERTVSDLGEGVRDAAGTVTGYEKYVMEEKPIPGDVLIHAGLVLPERTGDYRAVWISLESK